MEGFARGSQKSFWYHRQHDFHEWRKPMVLRDRIHGRMVKVLDCLEQRSRPEQKKTHSHTENRLVKRIASYGLLGALAGSIMFMLVAPEGVNRLAGSALVSIPMLAIPGFIYLGFLADRLVILIERRRRRQKNTSSPHEPILRIDSC